jgi:outer membrane immunogenic protein
MRTMGTSNLKAATILAALAMATPAAAQDGPANWSGLYVGAHGGWASSSTSGTLGYNDAAFPGFTAADIFNPVERDLSDADGWLGGVQIGYNHQISALVIGLEADIAHVEGDASGSFTSADTFTTWNIDSDIHSLATLRGRLGFAAGPLLPYVTGGFAWARSDAENAVTCVGCPVTPWATGDSTESHFGWVAGGGVEWALGSGWSLKSEYLYVDLGRQNHQFVGTAMSGTKEVSPGIYDYRSDSFDSEMTLQTVRLGVNYRFNGH